MTAPLPPEEPPGDHRDSYDRGRPSERNPIQNPEIQLFQAEWCPSSHRVRELLTEYGIDFMARQVPAEPGDRTLLLERTGTSAIPTLLLADGSVVAGVESILQHVVGIDPQPPSVQEHRAKAARVRAQQLQKELA